MPVCTLCDGSGVRLVAGRHVLLCLCRPGVQHNAAAPLPGPDTRRPVSTNTLADRAYYRRCESERRIGA